MQKRMALTHGSNAYWTSWFMQSTIMQLYRNVCLEDVNQVFAYVLREGHPNALSFLLQRLLGVAVRLEELEWKDSYVSRVLFPSHGQASVSWGRRSKQGA